MTPSKEKTLTIVVCSVFIIIFLINTVVLIFVYNKVQSLEEMRTVELNRDLDDLNKVKRKDIKELREELKELEKAGTNTDIKSKSK